MLVNMRELHLHQNNFKLIPDCVFQMQALAVYEGFMIHEATGSRRDYNHTILALIIHDAVSGWNKTRSSTLDRKLLGSLCSST